MVRGGKKEAAPAPANPEAEERKRLKDIAFSKGIISDSKSTASVALGPSKIVTKHHGADIIRKSQRKNRFLFSFPGLIAPLSGGGKIGDLKGLSTKNPILYLQFPQGQMKLFGTIVYPKNRYLTLQFSKGGKNVMCEDYFDTMIVFSDAWWIGRKEENPEEARLELPKELQEEHKAELDFKGGAGGASEIKQSAKKSEPKVVKPESPIIDSEDDFSDGQANLEDLQAVTPTRHSVRTAGKRINFAETSSDEDLVGNHVDTSEDEDKKAGDIRKSEISLPPFDIKNEDDKVNDKVEQSDKSMTKSKEITSRSRSSFVQTTISSLFKKVEDEKAPLNPTKSSSSKVAGQKLIHLDSGKRTNKAKDAGPRKKLKVIDESQEQTGSENVDDEQVEGSNLVETDKIYKRKTKKTAFSASVNVRRSRATVSKHGVTTNPVQSDDDEIEQFSSTSKESGDAEESDEDWSGQG